MLTAIFKQKGKADSYRGGSVADYGYRYSELVRLVGYNPAASSPIDPLHNSFLGLVMSFVNMLYYYHLLSASQSQAFVDVLTEAIYLGHLGRIPDRNGSQLHRNFDPKTGRKRRQQEADERNLASQMRTTHPTDNTTTEDNPRAGFEGERTGGNPSGPEGARKKRKKPKVTDINRDYAVSEVGTGIKADTWKRVAQLLPPGLFAAWRAEGSDDIIQYDGEDETYPVPANPAHKFDPVDPEQLPLNLNRQLWYQAALALSAGLRVLHAHHLSYDDAVLGTQTLSACATLLLSLGAHLTIN